ncbi:radical SAM protein [bacterium]|nr:radical SAM protein [bacterium]
MDKFFKSLKESFLPGPKAMPMQAGIYHYQAPDHDPLNYRLHLRLEEDGSALLIINAATVLHLNQTAAEYAYHIVQQTPFEEAVDSIQTRYNVSRPDILDDFEKLKEQIQTLIELPDLDPVTYMDMERHAPYSDSISAPYRLDCAITYKVPDNAPADVAPVKRVDRELTTEEWIYILDKAWKAGIPHIIFTGGEPTLRDDLSDMVNAAEQNGQVTGIITDGYKLSESNYLHSLLRAGLDHTLITLQPDQEKSWDSLASFSYWSETMDEDLFVAVHLTLTEENKEKFLTLIDKLAQAGISALSLSTNNKALADELKQAQEFAYAKDIELVWDLPVPYSTLNPIALELENAEEAETNPGAGRGWLYIEPDGDVLPGQGINRVLGNFLTDDWGKIWKAAQDYWENRDA